jgi:CMP-N-acetylneuraminic acid synthetase
MQNRFINQRACFFYDKSYGYIMSADESIYIDYNVGFKRCDSLIRNLGKLNF